MDFPLVIKVKYGETLRRFTASVGVNGLLDLDMARLTDQIRALFNFPPDADLALTYIDEDNDQVTLIDDNDLYDATRQKLNPLRIQVIKNMVRPARFESTCSSSRVVLPRPSPTVVGDDDGVKSDLEVPNLELCSDSETDCDHLKEGASRIIGDLLENTEKNIDHVKTKSTAAESSTREGLASDEHKQTPMESDMPNHGISPEALDVATKIRIMEAMSRKGETSDKVNLKSTVNEKSKPTTDHSDHFSESPVQDLTTPPTHTTQAVEASHTSINELGRIQFVNENTLPGIEVKVDSEAGTSTTAIDKGKSKIQLNDLTDPSNESSSFLQSDPSACFVEVDVDYEQMLLDALERMGFKQIELNKEVLRKNLFDLGQTITNLCDMGEWDELLYELEQMGFCDKEMNMELLKKNEGNVIDVVMALLSEEIE